MPSIAILTTPLRSEMTPPSAGRMRSAANWSVAFQRSLDVKTRSNICQITIEPPHDELRLRLRFRSLHCHLHFRSPAPEQPYSRQWHGPVQGGGEHATSWGAGRERDE